MLLESTSVQGLTLILDESAQNGAVVQESARILDRPLLIRTFVRANGKILDETGRIFIVVHDNGLFRDESVSLGEEAGYRTEWRLSKAEEDARKWRIRSAKRIVGRERVYSKHFDACGPSSRALARRALRKRFLTSR